MNDERGSILDVKKSVSVITLTLLKCDWKMSTLLKSVP